MAYTMTPTHAEKMAWGKMAQAAYRVGCCDVGHRFSAAAALPAGATIPLARFDMLMEAYRQWLIADRFVA